MKRLLEFIILMWTISGYHFQNPQYYVDDYESFASAQISLSHSVRDIIAGINFANHQRLEQLHRSLQHAPTWRFGELRDFQEEAQSEEISEEEEYPIETGMLRFRTNVNDNKTWTHDEQNDWPKKYPQCAGKRQSPVNLRARYLRVNRPSTCLQWNDYKTQLSMTTSLTRHTVEVSSPKGPSPILTGGPLTGDYKLNGIHFHWGYDQYDGSEHAINSRKSSLELHGVHYNTKFRNIAEAIASGESEALAVVAILFQASRKSNLGMTSVIERVKRGIALNDSISLSDFGFGFRNNYYSYLGSLTTPPCNEIVRWIVSGNIQYIKFKELKVLKTLVVDDKPLLDNFRQVQPINGRTIDHYKFC